MQKGQSVFDVKMPDPLVHRELLLAKGPAELQKSVEIPGKASIILGFMDTVVLLECLQRRSLSKVPVVYNTY